MCMLLRDTFLHYNSCRTRFRSITEQFKITIFHCLPCALKPHVASLGSVTCYSKACEEWMEIITATKQNKVKAREMLRHWVLGKYCNTVTFPPTQWGTHTQIRNFLFNFHFLFNLFCLLLSCEVLCMGVWLVIWHLWFTEKCFLTSRITFSTQSIHERHSLLHIFSWTSLKHFVLKFSKSDFLCSNFSI